MGNSEDLTLLRVLLVEDDEDDYILCREMLSEIRGPRFSLEWAATYDAARDAIARNQWDVCLLDYRFGEKSGLDLLQEAIALGCRAPMILLTGHGDQQIDNAAMQAG